MRLRLPCEGWGLGMQGYQSARLVQLDMHDIRAIRQSMGETQEDTDINVLLGARLIKTPMYVHSSGPRTMLWKYGKGIHVVQSTPRLGK